MSSISLFPCTFTPVHDVMRELSDQLELRIYEDADLFREMNDRFGSTPEKLKNLMYGTTSVFNQFTLEKEVAVNQFRSILADRLESSDRFLFHGLLSALIPMRLNEVLKVLIVDTKQNRISQAQREGSSKREAKKAIHNDDVSAYAWMDFLYHKEAYDSSLYDLVLPAGNLDPTRLTEEISHSFRKTAVLRTAESQKALEDVRLEIEVEKVLLKNGHKMRVRASNGDIVLKVDKSVLNYGKLVNELSGLAGEVTGVGSVTVEKGWQYNDSIYRQQKFELPSKVLFVDDEKEFVHTVSQRLNSRDVGTYGVFNGEEALELIADDRPDVMVLDLKMPGMHGVEVLRQTKKLAPEVEVIILTGHGTSQDAHDCKQLGAFAYLNKPVDIEELSATIMAANNKAKSNT